MFQLILLICDYFFILIYNCLLIFLVLYLVIVNDFFFHLLTYIILDLFDYIYA